MRVLLTGASGKLGLYLVDRLRRSSHQLVAWSGTAAGSRGDVSWTPVDLADSAAVERELTEADPDAIVHTAAVSSAALALRDPHHARAVNVDGTEFLVNWCDRRGRRLVFTSTDLVFDGGRPWSREADPPRPLVLYGRTKLEGERSVLALSDGVVARLSLLYGFALGSRRSFFDDAIADLQAGKPRAFFRDEYRTPLDYPTAAEILVRVMESQVTGLLHVGGPERLSRFDLMRRAGSALGIDPSLVRGNSLADYPGDEVRPADVSLDTSQLAALFPDLDRPPPERLPRGGSEASVF